MVNQRRQPDERNPLSCIGNRIRCESINRVRGAGKERLIVAPPQGEMCALGPSICDGENVALVLILQVEVILLDGRLLKIRIGNDGRSEESVPRKRRTR